VSASVKCSTALLLPALVRGPDAAGGQAIPMPDSRVPKADFSSGRR